MERCEMKVIARIRTDFQEKFGVPRQSGLVPELQGTVIFEPEFRSPEAIRGLEGFSHLWLIWEFSQSVREGWSPTVRPPRLGGNQRMGVFATRSPFRPNPIGLSSVELEKAEIDPELGPVLHVRGADLMDGTPIFDIKPYVPYADSHPEASGGFTDGLGAAELQVNCPAPLLEKFPAEKQTALLAVLANDPRPRYQDDAKRIYGMAFGGRNVKFSVEGETLTVISVE